MALLGRTTEVRNLNKKPDGWRWLKEPCYNEFIGTKIGAAKEQFVVHLGKDPYICWFITIPMRVYHTEPTQIP